MIIHLGSSRHIYPSQSRQVKGMRIAQLHWLVRACERRVVIELLNVLAEAEAGSDDFFRSLGIINPPKIKPSLSIIVIISPTLNRNWNWTEQSEM